MRRGEVKITYEVTVPDDVPSDQVEQVAEELAIAELEWDLRL